MATIFQISISPGGVPKHGLPQAEVTPLGLVGDEHRYHGHGGPDRALCIYSLELILQLQAEGHPVFPGALGENLTVAGMDWTRIVPGTQLRFGESVLAEVTEFTIPCNNLLPFLLAGDIERVGQKLHPGWARVYARILQTGTVKVGDRVAIVK